MRRLPYYRQIGMVLTERLRTLLRQGKHIALLGPRPGGKSLLLTELRRSIANAPERSHVRIVHIQWDRHRHLGRKQFLAYFANQMNLADWMPRQRRTIAGQLEDIIKQRVERSFEVTWLFIQDILAFPAPLARAILTALQACHADELCRSRLGVVVTGEHDFLSLTYGPNSPFNHATRFLVSGVDRALALELFCRRRQGQLIGAPAEKELADRVTDDQIEPQAFEYLYRATRGNPHLIQEIIVSAQRYPHPLRPTGPNQAWSLVDTKKCVLAFLTDFMATDYFSRRTLREVERDPAAFDLLLKILECGDGKVEIPGTDMHQLEVLGLVVRDDKRLASIACPIWRRFLKRLGVRQRIADAFARQQRWAEAWNEYQRIPRRQRDRPIAGEARDRLRGVLADWKESLTKHVPDSREAVCKQFFLGARHLLGFDAAGLYDFSEAVPKPLTICNFDEPRLANYLRQRSSCQADTDGYPQFSLNRQRLVLRSAPNGKLHSAPNADPVLLLKRRGNNRAIDSGDQSTLRDALASFWRAYLAADQIEYRRTIGEMRERHLKVIEKVNSLLLCDPFDMGQVVQGAADALVQIGGYYRILICLLDPRQERIQAVANRCLDPKLTFNFTTNFPLDRNTPDKNWDIQQWVAIKGEACVVPDASSRDQVSPRTQWEKVSTIGMKAITVVPMKVQEEVLGTIHFERIDREMPSKAERDLFDILAGQIAVAFHLARRLTLLQESVMKLYDQIVIFDAHTRPLFLNEAAAKAQKMSPGWQTPGGTNTAVASIDDRALIQEAEANAKKAAKAAERVAEHDVAITNVATHHYRFEGEGNSTQATDRLAAPIDDFRVRCPEPFKEADGRIGYVVRDHDLTPIYRVSDSLQSWLAGIHTSPSKGALALIADAVLKFFKARNFQWCRLYLLKRDSGGDYLEGLKEFGLDDSSLIKRDFHAGKVRFSRKDHAQPFHVLDAIKNDPAIYEYDPNLKPGQAPVEAPNLEGRSRYFTNDQPYRELFNKLGTQWIEAPLRLGERRLGIVSLALPDKLLPEDWELLKHTVLAASVALADALRADEMELANRNISDFFSKMHHDILTPLSCIIRRSEELRADERLDKGHLHVVQAVLDHADGLSSLIDDVLDWGKIHAGHTNEEPRAFNLREMLDALQREFASRTQNGVRVKLEASDISPVVRGPRKKIREVLKGLLSNAVKYTRDGFVILRVSQRDGQFRFEVEDSGPGIPEEDQPYVFEWYRRAHTAGEIQGHGIGLANCKERVQSMGGELRLTSTVGRGTAFSFSILLPAAASTEVLQLVAPPRVKGLSPGQEPRRILIVDDVQEAAELLSKKLFRLGFQTREAHSGEDAVRVWNEWRPHLIFMDIVMPGITGRVATERIRSADPNATTVIIALTAQPLTKSDRAFLHSEGFDNYARQCTNEDEIVKLLEKHLLVRFDFESDASASLDSPASLKNLWELPPDLREQLRSAAVRGDGELAQEIVAQVANLNPRLVEHLAAVIEQSAWDLLIQVLADGESQ